VRSCIASATLACLLAGCGSTDASSHSVAGIKAAGQSVASNLEAGSFRKACEGFTASARRRLAVFPKAGCSGALAFSRGLLAIEGKERIGLLFEHQLARLLPQLQIHGDSAVYKGVVEARFERGRWRFEGRSDEMTLENPHLKSELEQAITSLRSHGASTLLEEVTLGAR